MNKIYHAIMKCRACGNEKLLPILSLGNQALTGVFPKTKEQQVLSGPLELVKCDDFSSPQSCGLLQLKHSYESAALYGEGYGYRSSLNKSMVNHLHAKVKKIIDSGILKSGDLIIDIGSNDGTLLKAYPHKGFTLAGIDPSAGPFRKFYPEHISLITDFFSGKLVKSAFGLRKAKVVTSIAMFYDLEEPVEFMRQVHEILADDGIWILEQSYMPTMLERLAYDTICHEHLEYYDLKQVLWMAQAVGLNVIDVQLNDINGGSFEVTLAKNRKPTQVQADVIENLLAKEKRSALRGQSLFNEFKAHVFAHRDELRAAVDKINREGKRIFGYGASTKGNVILQFCGFTPKEIPYIAEVNQDKFGSFTPGTNIPIISEEEARAMKPDYMLVLPWHFRENIIAREQSYLRSGGKLFFPLPKLEIISQ